MATDEQEANATDVPIDDEPIDDPESLLDLEFEDEEDEDDDVINMDDIDQGVDPQVSESESESI
jgi:hypothetical protein